jgi:SAM-dependent methyltransferase
MEFSKNCYEDSKRADAYSKLEFPGTYYLAFRDLPQIFRQHIHGKKALDFGCGTGRSTRFLKQHGFDAIGVDISQDMLSKAGNFDPQGEYHLIADGDFSRIEKGAYDLVLSAFTFDNIPVKERKVALFSGLAGLLKADGRIVNLVSAPEIYVHEWASFSTRDFPENRQAKSGDVVRIIMTDVEDRRPVEDVICFDDDYLDVYTRSGLSIVESYRPLGRDDEPYAWVNETRVAPWVIYVLSPF